MTTHDTGPHGSKMSFMRRLVVLAGLCLLAGAAQGGVVCSLSASDVAFGNYDPLAATADDVAGTITITCNYVPPGGEAEAQYVLRLSTGLSGNYTLRRMASGPARLGYNLFRNAGHTQVMGSGSGGSSEISGTLQVTPGLGKRTNSRTFTVYGRMPALQSAPAGTYLDTIVATLNY
jgi:spore coat protein U-like protein